MKERAYNIIHTHIYIYIYIYIIYSIGLYFCMISGHQSKSSEKHTFITSYIFSLLL